MSYISSGIATNYLAYFKLYYHAVSVDDYARVAELVDALDLGSSGATRESSSLSFRTIIKNLVKNA